jgi:hypothetical protein
MRRVAVALCALGCAASRSASGPPLTALHQSFATPVQRIVLDTKEHVATPLKFDSEIPGPFAAVWASARLAMIAVEGGTLVLDGEASALRDVHCTDIVGHAKSTIWCLDSSWGANEGHFDMGFSVDRGHTWHVARATVPIVALHAIATREGDAALVTTGGATWMLTADATTKQMTLTSRGILAPFGVGPLVDFSRRVVCLATEIEKHTGYCARDPLDKASTFERVDIPELRTTSSTWEGEWWGVTTEGKTLHAPGGFDLAAPTVNDVAPFDVEHAHAHANGAFLVGKRDGGRFLIDMRDTVHGIYPLPIEGPVVMGGDDDTLAIAGADAVYVTHDRGLSRVWPRK